MGEVVVSSSEEGGLEKRDGSAAAVQWEKYLPRTALRVLLVESDDSTRQIISALLRKCSYKVSAVPDGLKAWQMLKGKHHNIDIVLTEVELPSISGFALLTLVMEHDVCKNIPVIMMSSHHSISTVLKCMLKGAADFLIKPVRKNELRNLWQHVWRRHTLSGGYIAPNLTAAQQKLEAGTDNNTASNHSSDYVVSSCRDKDSSEKGNDAHSSCRMPFMEAENAHMQNIQGLSQPKCKIASNLTNFDVEKQEESATLPQESVIQKGETEDNPNKFGSNVAGPFNDPYNSIALRLREEHDCAKATTQYESVGTESAGNGNITSESSGNRREADEPLTGAIDFIGTFDNRPMCSHVQSCRTNAGSYKFECVPQLELSLRRFCPMDDKTDERHAFNHTNASTLSRYSNNKTLHSFFPTMAGTCTELEGTDKIHYLSSHCSESTIGTSQNGATLGNNEENTTSIVDVQSGQVETAFSRPITRLRYDDIHEGCSPGFASAFYAKSDFRSTHSPKPACQQEMSPSIDANPKINHLKQGYQRSAETSNNCDNQSVNEEKSLEGMEELRHDVSSSTSQSCSTSLCNGLATQLSSNMHGSISTRSGVTVDAIEQANAPENLNDVGLACQDGLRTGSLRSSEREAALTKFRLKRKDRCYEKKVRYQSRKRLAEQRPRVKGQFVRQAQTTIAGADG